MACPHPGTIFKRENSIKINGYNTDYKIASDYDHICRYIKNFNTAITLDNILVNILAGGVSETKNIEAYLEEELIRKRIFNASDWSVYNRMLTKSSQNISHLVNQLISD